MTLLNRDTLLLMLMRTIESWRIDDSVNAIKSASLTESQGRWLDWWGEKVFEVVRDTGETDTDYRERIFAKITELKVTPDAIKGVMGEVFGTENTDYTLVEYAPEEIGDFILITQDEPMNPDTVNVQAGLDVENGVLLSVEQQLGINGSSDIRGLLPFVVKIYVLPAHVNKIPEARKKLDRIKAGGIYIIFDTIKE